MLAQSDCDLMQFLHFLVRCIGRHPPGKLFHRLINILQLAERGPALILSLPLWSGRDPYSKSFGKIFGGMRLGVPSREVEDVIAAVRLRFVPVGIGASE